MKGSNLFYGQVGINSFGSNVTLDTFNNRVFNHEVFGVSKRFDIAANAVMNVIIDPTEKGAFPKKTFVFLPIFVFTHGAGPVEIDIYVGTDSDDDGTEWKSIDRYFEDAIVPHTVVRLNPTINADGIKTEFEDRIESSSGLGIASDVGGSVKGDFLIIPLKNIKTMIRLTNTDVTNPARGVFKFNFFEVD